MKICKAEAREFFRRNLVWGLVREELAARLVEVRRLCSTLDDVQEIRRYQGAARELERLLAGGVEGPVVDRLKE